MCIRLFQSRLDVLASRDDWVFWGEFVRVARRDWLISRPSANLHESAKMDTAAVGRAMAEAANRTKNAPPV